MLLGFKTQLKVNQQQRLLLAQHAGVARHAWNQGLCQQVLIHNKRLVVIEAESGLTHESRKNKPHCRTQCIPGKSKY